MKRNLNNNFLQKSSRNGSLQSFLRQVLKDSLRILPLVFLGIYLFSSCTTKKTTKDKTKTTSKVISKPAKDVYYTCSMHTQVHLDHPGHCPICNMKLIAVSKTNKMHAHKMKMVVDLSPQQIRLGNIKTDTVKEGVFGDKLLLTGTLNFNEEKLNSVSARVKGRVDKLYFKNEGDYVHKGDKLYDLYSEKLNNAKQEYVNALQQTHTISGHSLINYKAIVQSAKTKLLLWGMTNAQINRLAQSKEVPTHTSFYSTESGFITSISIKEGDYVMEGGTVVQLADLSTLWAEAQVYSSQMSLIHKGESAIVNIPSMNNETIHGTIDFINPEINPDGRINLIRTVIPNKDKQLRPGMPVYISVIGQQHKSLELPSSAFLKDTKGTIVWIQTMPGVYEMRKVKTGSEENNKTEIMSGLKKGEIVVTSGVYLLNSEYIFEHGSNSMGGMKM